MRRPAILALALAGASLTLSAQSAFTITTKSLPTAIFGQPYAPVALDTTGDPGPMTWSFLASAPAPSGFVVGPAPFNTQGIFCYGFPTAGGPPLCTGAVQTFPGVYTFIVQATSLSSGQSAAKQLSIAVVAPLQIVTTTLPDAAANQAYAVQIATQGGTGQFAWTVPFGTLPPGITLDPALGTLAGTAPNLTATYNFTVQVQDQITLAVASRAYTLNVLGGIAITTVALPNATVNQVYSFQMESAGGRTMVWSIPPGWTLPAGFSISSSGLLTGFGLSTGIFPTRIQALEVESMLAVTRDYTLNVTLGPLHIVESILPTANQNVAYNATLHAAGGIPPYRWSFDIPSPQSMNISPTAGGIFGTPPNAGTFALPVSLKDATGQVFSQSFVFSVLPAVSITTSALANGLPGVPYSDTVVATGGSLPYRWSVATGALPPGLGLNATSGQIAGTPSASGVFTFTVQVIDFLAGTATKTFSITIGAGQLLTITTTSLPDGGLNQPYSQSLAATGGTAPFAWTLGSGTLPTGLTLDAATGVISGTPTTLGNFAFDVVVTDVNKATARKSLTINIGNAATPVVITSGNFTGAVLSAFSQTVTASGGTPPYTFSIPSGSLPPGLQLNASTGVISGTPTAGGTSTFTVTATDARNQTGSKTISITIILPPPPATSIGVGTTTQPAVSLTTGAPYPVDITGVLTLTFASSVGGTGEEVRFAPSGSRSLNFTVPANTTQANFQTANAAIVTGTLAGTITLKASLSAGGQDITPSTPPTRTITIDAAVPVINSVALQQVTGGINVVVTGYSNTREVSSGSFTFTVSSGNTLSVATLVVPLTSAYTAWFNNSASNPTGGQFKLTVPFSVTGSATAITKVTVTLTNSKGASAAASSP
ncbi:MAG TPA: putative Ig domain-containing protein [Bryobacteraceae bacterium]|nr:putative Ig domain-containing protein [Bryobacteraceae bacterium]